MKRLVALILFWAFNAYSEPWTDTQKVLSASYLTAHVIDWGQTRDSAKNYYGEKNTILGAHPSVGKVNAYFVLTPILLYYALDAIPEYRTPALVVLTAVEIAVIARNYRIGVKVAF
jgi:hypothetical protein